MIRRAFVVAMALILAGAGVSFGAEMFRFELLDGTVLTGTMDAAALSVKTSYGTLKVPAADCTPVRR